tara:strand:+ start:149 stop:289 length:141 start_codon:yes stop_codon:yes gene_type:complete
LQAVGLVLVCLARVAQAVIVVQLAEKPLVVAQARRAHLLFLLVITL